MMEIKRDPAVILKTKAETLEYILKGDKDKHDNPKSVWLCDVLNQMQAENNGGMVYNRQACERISKENGIPDIGPSASVLSWLVYLAQSYRVSDTLIADGWEYLSDEMITAAIESGDKIEVYGDYGNTVCRPSLLNGRYCVLLPRSRTKGYTSGTGFVARIVKSKAKSETPRMPVIFEVTL